MAVTMSMRVSATAALLCGLQAASAQDTDEVTVEVGECIALEAPVERLACFASQVEQALSVSEAAASDDSAEQDDGVEQEDGAEQDDAGAVDGRAVEASPAQPADAEPPPPARQADAEQARPAAASQRASESEGQDREPDASDAADADGQADAEDLNWWQRRQARRAARAAEREAAEQAEAAEAAENQIVATIAALRERGPNSYLITLDNGQMWDQVRPQWYALRPGLEVRLYPTNWGESHRLTSVEHGGFIQVRRVR